MKQKFFQLLSFQFSVKFMLVLLTLVLAFHLSVVLQIVPYTIVWAGKLNSVKEMLVFETVSIAINLLLLFTLIKKKNNVLKQETSKPVQFILWLFTIIFALNTIGNLFAESGFETIVFTPITFISAILCFRIVKEK